MRRTVGRLSGTKEAASSCRTPIHSTGSLKRPPLVAGGNRCPDVTPAARNRHNAVMVVELTASRVRRRVGESAHVGHRVCSAVRQNVAVGADDLDDQTLSDTDRVSLWLMSADGRRALQRTLRDLKLSTAFDADLITQV